MLYAQFHGTELPQIHTAMHYHTVDYNPALRIIESYELMIVEQGEWQVWYPGGCQKLLPGDFVMCLPNISHRVCVSHPGKLHSDFSIGFSWPGSHASTSVPVWLPSLTDPEHISPINESYPLVIPMFGSVFLPEFLSDLCGAIADWDAGDCYCKTLVATRLLQVLVRVSKQAMLQREKTADTAPSTRQLVTAVIHSIQQHLTQSVKVSDLASALNVNPSYLGTVFRRLTGLTINEHLARLRIARAKELLGVTDQSIGEISLAVGYTDPFYFSRIFHQIEGISPSAYRTLVTDRLIPSGSLSGNAL